VQSKASLQLCPVQITDVGEQVNPISAAQALGETEHLGLGVEHVDPGCGNEFGRRLPGRETCDVRYQPRPVEPAAFVFMQIDSTRHLLKVSHFGAVITK
jgi:hypothetical protein